jgi:hypothetical protein
MIGIRVRETSGLVVAAALLVVGGLAAASGARAAPVPETGDPGELTLSADPFPVGTHDLAPGGTVRWQITASVDQAGGATLYLTVTGHGVMALDPAGVMLAVEWCATDWTVPSDVSIAATCAGGVPRTVLAATPIAAIAPGRRAVDRVSSGVPSHLLVTAALPMTSGTRFVNDAGSVDLVFDAAGDQESVSIGSGPGSSLASTGSLIAGPALLAAGLLLAGICVAGIRQRRARIDVSR